MSLTINTEVVRSYVRARLPGFKLEGAHSDKPQWRGGCPIHDGRDPNFAIDSATGQWRCHSRCGIGGSILDLEIRLGHATTKAEAVSSISTIAGRPVANGNGSGSPYKVVAYYEYKDKHGTLISRTVRKENGTGKKKFHQERFENGRWMYGLGGLKPPLYRLTELLANVDAPVFLPEGEKDVDALRARGFVASCNAMGAGKWRAELAEFLHNRHCVIIPDDDEPGRKHAEQIARSLVDKAKSIKVVPLPGAKDAAAFFGIGRTADSLRLLVDAAPNWTPATKKVETTEESVDGFHLTELGNAKRFVSQYGDCVRYCHPFGEWFVYDPDDGRWTTDTSGEVDRKIKATIAAMAAEADNESDRESNSLARWAKKSETVSGVNAIRKLAESELGIPVGPADFDSDPWMLNLKNCVVDLRTGEAKEHDRAALTSKLAPVVYEPRATCPRWLQFLGQVFEPHPEVIPFLQRAAGYSLTASTREECLFLLWGTGRNGKGTLLGTLAEALGDYAHAADFATFVRRRDDSGPRDDIAAMLGKRFVIAQESREGAAFAESLIKHLTGGDKVRARRLYQNSFEFLPTHKIWLATNHRPDIRGGDIGIWSRIRLVPFTVSFEGREDRGLKGALLEELPGILNWAITGCLEWAAVGLQPPQVVLDATAEYREESDIVTKFLKDCCLIGQGECKARALYSEFKSWAAETGEELLSETNFGRRLIEKDFRRKRKDSGNIYDKIALKPKESS